MDVVVAGITADLEGLARQRTARLDDPTSLAHILFGMLHAGPESSHGAARCIVAFNSATLNDMLHKLGAIPLLVRLLHVDASSYAGTRAIWTLNRRKSNIDNATASAIKNTTRDAGAIEPLVALLQSTNLAVASDSASALGTICRDNSRNKDTAFAAGALPPLIALLQCSAERHADALKAKRAAAGSIQVISKAGPVAENALLDGVFSRMPLALDFYGSEKLVCSLKMIAWTRCEEAIKRLRVRRQSP